MKYFILCFASFNFLVCSSFTQRVTNASAFIISQDVLYDKIYGGWTGMLIGGLEGLPHEFKFDSQPRETVPDI